MFYRKITFYYGKTNLARCIKRVSFVINMYWTFQ